MQKVLRPREVVEITGLSKTTIWRKVRAGIFPAPIELGPNSIGWETSDIEAWLASRPRRGGGMTEDRVAA